ncbi:MAG TPA: hypothetical protein VF857_11300 [Spirochaetota bacterium]
MNERKLSRWISRQSEFAGFEKAYYCTDAKGDYVRVDVNVGSRRALLLVEDRFERRYMSLIENGSIVSEKIGDSTSRGAEVQFRKKATLFSMAPSDAFSIIRGFYGIGVVRKRRRKKKARKRIYSAFVVSIGLLVACAVILFLCFR